MDFAWSDEQRSIYQTARQFAEKAWQPHAATWDKESIFPTDALKEAASLGFAALYVKPEHQGSGVTRLDAALVFEALSEACVSTAAYLSIHNMVAWLIDRYAEDGLRQLWLPRLATMDSLASYCLTEPDAGSDAASLTTSAKLDGDHYVINGNKAFISGGGTSDIYACMVRTGEPGAQGISCILVEKGTEGLRFGEYEHKLGWRTQPTTMVFFDNCRVPKSHLVGELGQGFKIALHALNGGRINIAACSLGGALSCLKAVKRYLHERKQFGKPLSDFQALQFRFAELWSDYNAARLMVHRAASALDKNEVDAPLWCAMAKRFASDVGFQTSDAVLQMFGGYGYLKDYPIERYFRDLRVHQILEGTNEIMRLIIARRILQDDFSLGE